MAELITRKAQDIPVLPQLSLTDKILAADPTTSNFKMASIQKIVDLISSFGNASFKGKADLSTVPGIPTSPVFYLSVTPGSYTNFGGVVVNAGSLAVISYNGSAWSVSQNAMLTDYFTKTQVDANIYPEKLTLGAFFYQPYYELSGGGYLFFKPTEYGGTGGDVFYIRGGFYGNYQCNYAKLKADIDAAPSGDPVAVITGQTSPLGVTDCIRFDPSSVGTLYFNPSTSTFVGQARQIKKTGWIKLIENDRGGQAGDCTERPAIIASLERNKSNLLYAPVKFNSVNLTPNAYFYNAYYEMSGSLNLYIKADGFYARSSALGADYTLATWAAVVAKLNENPNAVFETGQTSPLGITDCVKLNASGTGAMYFNFDTATLKAMPRGNYPGWLTLMINSVGTITDGTEKSVIEAQLVKNALTTKYDASISNGLRRLQDNIGFYTYDEASLVVEESAVPSGSVFFKFQNGGLFFRGIYSNQYQTWAALKTKLDADLVGATVPIVYETSPSGVEDCIKLVHTQCLCWNYVTNKFELPYVTALLPHMYPIIHCENGLVGRQTRDLNILRKAIENKGKKLSNTMYSQILPLAKAYGKGRFTFTHASDVHFNSSNASGNMTEWMAFCKDALVSPYIKLNIFSGDYSNGTAARTKSTTIAEITAAVTSLLTSTVPVLSLIGNHDDNVNFIGGTAGVGTNVYPNAINKQQQYDLMIAPFKAKWAAFQTTLNKGYQYIDFATDKVRVVALDFLDFPIEEGTTANTIKYNITGFYYSQAQLDWLNTTLNTTPTDYAVVMVVHGAAIVNWEVGWYLQGRQLIFDIINAWKTGGSFTHSYVDGTYAGFFSTSKVFDFTTRGVGEYVCMLTGHTHSLEFLHPANYPDQNVIIVGALWSDTGNPVMPRDTANDELKSSFNVLSIDRAARKIFVTTFGAFRDVNGNNKERIKILSY